MGRLAAKLGICAIEKLKKNYTHVKKFEGTTKQTALRYIFVKQTTLRSYSNALVPLEWYCSRPCDAAAKRITRKAITERFSSLKFWQQKLLLASLIDRCSGSELEQLNNILEPLSHRGYKASFNKQYPAEGLKPRIDVRKAQVKIHRIFDKVWSMKLNWQKTSQKNKRYALRNIYLQEQWRPSTPLYYQADTRDFSYRIQQAVTKLLREEDLPVRASAETASELAGIIPKVTKQDIHIAKKSSQTICHNVGRSSNRLSEEVPASQKSPSGVSFTTDTTITTSLAPTDGPDTETMRQAPLIELDEIVQSSHTEDHIASEVAEEVADHALSSSTVCDTEPVAQQDDNSGAFPQPVANPSDASVDNVTHQDEISETSPQNLAEHSASESAVHRDEISGASPPPTEAQPGNLEEPDIDYVNQRQYWVVEASTGTTQPDQLGAGAVGVLAPSATSTVPTLHLNQLAVVPNETLIPLTTETEESPTPHRRADDVEVPQSRISRALDRTLRYRSTSTDTTTTGTNTDSTEYSTTYEGTDYENDPSTFTINLSSLPADTMSTDAVTSMLSDTQPGSLLHPGLDHPTQVLSGASLHPELSRSGSNASHARSRPSILRGFVREPDPPAVQPVEPRISAPLVSAPPPPPPPPPVSTSGSDAADDIASSAINPDVAGVVYSDQITDDVDISPPATQPSELARDSEKTEKSTSESYPSTDSITCEVDSTVHGLILRPGTIIAPSPKSLQPESFEHRRARCREATGCHSLVDIVEELPHFNVIDHDADQANFELEGRCDGRVVEVIEPHYIPSQEEQLQEDLMVREFASAIHCTLKKSMDLIQDEDDLADEVARCLLASTVGLALVSTDDKTRLTEERFFNLRERLSCKAMQATIKVFRINPPAELQPEAEEDEAAAIQYVEPFTLTGDNLLRKVSSPHNYFITRSKKRKPAIPQRSVSRIMHSRSMHSPAGYIRSSTRIGVGGPSSRSKPAPLRRKKKSVHITVSDESVASPPIPYEEEARVPDIDGMDLEEFFRPRPWIPIIGCDLDVQFNPKEQMFSKFKEQLDMMLQDVTDWQASDVISLVADMIKHSYSNDNMVLPLVKMLVTSRSACIQNINELPDRIMIKLFSCLDVTSLGNCQEVCRRWRFLCSRPQLWMQKCNQLGRKYKMSNLCKRILEETGEQTVDWQRAYCRIHTVLKRSTEKLHIEIHPAVRAKSDYSSDVDLCRGEIHHLPPVKKKLSNILTPTVSIQSMRGSLSEQTCQLPQLNAHGNSTVDNKSLRSRTKGAEISQAAERPAVRNKRDYVQRTRFPKLKLMDQKLVWAEQGTERVRQPPECMPESVKEGISQESFGSWNEGNVDGASRRPAAHSLLQAKLEEREEVDDTIGDVAIDIRTDLTPASQLHRLRNLKPPGLHFKPLHKGTKRKDEQHEDQSNAGHSMMGLMCQNNVSASESRPNAEHGTLHWMKLDQFDPRDPTHKKMFMGYVKPISYVHKFKGRDVPVYSCASDRNRVFTGDLDGIVSLWDIRSGRLVHELISHSGSVRGMSLDSENDILYTASWDKTVIMWDLLKLEVRAIFVGHKGVVVDVKHSTKLNRIVSASYDSTVKIWSTTTFSCMQTLHHHIGNIICLCYDGNNIASGGNDKQVTLYRQAKHSSDFKYYGKYLTSLTLKDISSVTEIAISSGQPWNKRDRDKYMANDVTSVLVMNDLVLGGTNHGELYCWCAGTASVVAIFDVHIGAVNSLNLWCNRILTSGSDGIVKEWDLRTMTCVRRIHDHPSAIHCTKVDELRERIVSVGDDGLIHVWHFKKDKKKPKVVDSSIKTLKIPIYALETLESPEEK